MKINGREIGDGCPAYIIAELSANHAGSKQRALPVGTPLSFEDLEEG